MDALEADDAAGDPAVLADDLCLPDLDRRVSGAQLAQHRRTLRLPISFGERFQDPAGRKSVGTAPIVQTRDLAADDANDNVLRRSLPVASAAATAAAAAGGAEVAVRSATTHDARVRLAGDARRVHLETVMIRDDETATTTSSSSRLFRIVVVTFGQVNDPSFSSSNFSSSSSSACDVCRLELVPGTRGGGRGGGRCLGLPGADETQCMAAGQKDGTRKEAPTDWTLQFVFHVF